MVSVLLLCLVTFLLVGCRNDASTPPPATPIPTAPRLIPTETMHPPPLTPTPRLVRHKVEAGETLYLLAEQYGTTIEAILEANPEIENPDLIQIGMELVIPLPPE